MTARIFSFLIDKRKIVKAPHFQVPATSGLITGVAAGTSSAGHLFSLRNPDPLILLYVSRLRMYWQTTTGFTAAQEMALEAYRVSSYTVDASGGTAVTPQKRRTGHATAAKATARIATTGALTAGTLTFAAQPLLARRWLELADGAAIAKGNYSIEWQPRDDHPIVLAQNEGLVIRNAILMGAAGVGRLTVEVDTFER